MSLEEYERLYEEKRRGLNAERKLNTEVDKTQFKVTIPQARALYVRSRAVACVVCMCSRQLLSAIVLSCLPHTTKHETDPFMAASWLDPSFTPISDAASLKLLCTCVHILKCFAVVTLTCFAVVTLACFALVTLTCFMAVSRRAWRRLSAWRRTLGWT